jgi:hypothetical protein
VRVPAGKASSSRSGRVSVSKLTERGQALMPALDLIAA